MRRSAANERPQPGGPGWWSAYLEAGGPHCAYCRRAVGYERLTRDHIVPRSRGGRTEARNVLPVCGSCNRKKRSRPLRAFATALEALEPAAHPVHALGEVVDGEWVWSDAALDIHARAA